MSPYWGAGVSVGFEYYKNGTEKSFTEKVKPVGILGSEFFISEHCSFFIEYRLEFIIAFEQNPESDNNKYETGFSVNATELMMGMVLYFGP